MTDLDSDKKQICITAAINEDGNEIIPERGFHYDTLVVAQLRFL